MTAHRGRSRAAMLDALRGQLIVSCQASPDEALHGPVFMAAMARAVLDGGAGALRIEGPDDIAAVRPISDVPLIGLWKVGQEPVYITPTMHTVDHVIAAGADIVALDATGRERPDGSSLRECVALAHRRGALVMGDVATLEQGVAACDAGVDLVGTTLSGYLDDGPVPSGPDLDVVESLATTVPIPVIAEGRFATPGDAVQAMAAGAWAVVVGGAITRPAAITRRFVHAMQGSW